jgi:hypothetical protein
MNQHNTGLSLGTLTFISPCINRAAPDANETGIRGAAHNLSKAASGPISSYRLEPPTIQATAPAFRFAQVCR